MKVRLAVLYHAGGRSEPVLLLEDGRLVDAQELRRWRLVRREKRCPSSRRGIVSRFGTEVPYRVLCDMVSTV